MLLKNSVIVIIAMTVCIFCSSPFINIFFHFTENQRNYIDEDVMLLLSYCGVSYFAFRFYGNVKGLVVICKRLSGEYEKILNSIGIMWQKLYLIYDNISL